MKNLRITALLLVAMLLASVETAALEIVSPDKRIQLHTDTENGQVFYSVAFDGTPIVARSRLGVALKGGAFAGSLKVSDSKTRSFDETWKPVVGEFSQYRNRYNELTLKLQEVDAPRRAMNVILRAYDDGVAFRYEFPEQAGLSQVKFDTEYTEVSVVSKNPIAWYVKSSASVSGETPFAQLSPSSPIEGRTRTMMTPFTARLADDCFISLHEAGVLHAADATLEMETDARTLRYVSQSEQEAGCFSPWRTLTISKTPGGLIESSLILNLNELNALADTSWIKPGISLWDWRNHGAVADDGFVYGINTESYIRYIDFAHEQGLQFVLIDAEWYGSERDDASDPTTYEHEVDIPGICEYAKSKGIGIWLYINRRALVNFDLDRTFSTYRKWGVVGIKDGFQNGSSQEKIEFSTKVLKKCAEYHIMYDLHEPNKPTGIRRTYPHFLSREYVNGMLDGPKRPSLTPTDLCTFPVAHNLAGPVDRSSGMFDLDESLSRDKVHRQIPSTVVSQVAQCLVFPSGLLTLPDHPDAYRRKIDLFEFIKQMPMTWDETRVPQMEVGKSITLARRTGQVWLVASLANEEGGELELPLDFIESGITYDVTLYEDTAESDYHYNGASNRIAAKAAGLPFEPTKTKRELYQIRKQQVKKGDVIKAKIAPGGGHCMWIRPAIK